MKIHLTEAQGNDLLLGVADSDAARHVEACADCAAELARVRSALADFRTAAVDWSEVRTACLPVRRHRPVAGNWGHRLAWAAAMAVMLAVPVLRRGHARPAPAVASDSADQIARDNRLLAVIHAEVNEAVPAPMQPLGLDASSRVSQ